MNFFFWWTFFASKLNAKIILRNFGSFLWKLLHFLFRENFAFFAKQIEAKFRANFNIFCKQTKCKNDAKWLPISTQLFFIYNDGQRSIILLWVCSGCTMIKALRPWQYLCMAALFSSKEAKIYDLTLIHLYNNKCPNSWPRQYLCSCFLSIMMDKFLWFIMIYVSEESVWNEKYQSLLKLMQ